MTDFLRVAGAQIDLVVGDIDGNVARIAEAMRWAEDIQADVLLFPELAVTGYPPEDLVLREGFVSANIAELRFLASGAGSTASVVGFVDRSRNSRRDDAGHNRVHNAAALLAEGKVRGIYHKCLLPNYGVFDEDRYFAAGQRPDALWEINGAIVGVSVCEDIWVPDGPPAAQAKGGADILLNINGSPYHRGKGAEREKMIADRSRAYGLPVVYLNAVGGQDELVFDGQSMVFAAGGELLYRAPQFEEDLFWVDVPLPESGRADVDALTIVSGDLLEGEPETPPESYEPMGEEEEVYRALVTGLRDYTRKNRFENVVVGLSGGIDSSLTAAIAADALGPESVWGVTMPSRYSSDGSVSDSRALAENLGIRFDEISIEPPFEGFLEALSGVFQETEEDVTEENLQARVRGAILMALSNKFGGMVVATGNKSEMSVGYATLYGDMVGGYAVLKDVYKTLIFRIAEWRNRAGDVIPRAVIDKPPSAELRLGQLDTDSLPPYEVLDPILMRYIEGDQTADEIVASGFERALVERITRLVDRNEYKRRQAAPGVKITTKALGRDRRLPITNRYGQDQDS
ncbi:MAG TPA: NAD+ synthase [Acidimicrobiia bacterium]|nr:NAD+ synthase [Acidimicrobiia bacterium]